MMSFLPYMVHYCADLLWSVRRGGAPQNGRRRQLFRSKAKERELGPALSEMLAGVKVGGKNNEIKKIYA